MSLPASPRIPTYFNPRPPRGGRRVILPVALPIVHISIHALREEGDECVVDDRPSRGQISIHALREEGDWIRLIA